MVIIEKIKNFFRLVLRQQEQISDDELKDLIDKEIEDYDDEEETLDDKTDDYQSVVSFLVSKQGNIDLNISWNTNDEITGKNLAILLYLINNGTFEQNCANLLLSIAQNDPSSLSFIRFLIEEWNSKKRTDSLIKPSEVFQFGTVGTREE